MVKNDGTCLAIDAKLYQHYSVFFNSAVTHLDFCGFKQSQWAVLHLWNSQTHDVRYIEFNGTKNGIQNFNLVYWRKFSYQVIENKVLHHKISNFLVHVAFCILLSSNYRVIFWEKCMKFFKQSKEKIPFEDCMLHRVGD